jgi:hypothetical protein
MMIHILAIVFRAILGKKGLAAALVVSALAAPSASLGGDVVNLDKKNSRYVVFIHTGGGDPNVASKLATALLDAGLQVPKADDYRDTIGGAGVDYFSRDDIEIAAFVADQANKLLPSGSPPLKPRYQSSVRNPPGFLGVWLYSPWSQSTAKEPADWGARPPVAAWCYQEYDPGTQQFLIACHSGQSNCDTARGTNNPKPGSACLFTDLRSAVWNPLSDGYLRSWYQFSDSEAGSPFPQIDADVLAKVKAAANNKN